jgi:hypothetical protein
MRTALRRALHACLVALLLVQLVGCGTLLYPERRGQPSGKFDADIVILDAVGLFFFFVPGVVAFAVDLATGAIYLPQGEKSKVGQMFGQEEIRRYDLESRDLDEIVAFVEAKTGLPIYRDSLRVVRGRPEASIESRLRELNAQIAVARSAEL